MCAYQDRTETPVPLDLAGTPETTEKAEAMEPVVTAEAEETAADTAETVVTAEAAETGSDSTGKDRDRVYLLLSNLIIKRNFSGRTLCYRADQEDIDGISRWLGENAPDATLWSNYREMDSVLASALPGTLTLLYLHEIPAAMPDAAWRRLENALEQDGSLVLQTSTYELHVLPPWLLAGSMMIHTSRYTDDNQGMWLYRIRLERR